MCGGGGGAEGFVPFHRATAVENEQPACSAGIDGMRRRLLQDFSTSRLRCRGSLQHWELCIFMKKGKRPNHLSGPGRSKLMLCHRSRYWQGISMSTSDNRFCAMIRAYIFPKKIYPGAFLMNFGLGVFHAAQCQNNDKSGTVDIN
jgi:hypothetical protein